MVGKHQSTGSHLAVTFVINSVVEWKSHMAVSLECEFMYTLCGKTSASPRGQWIHMDFEPVIEAWEPGQGGRVCRGTGTGRPGRDRCPEKPAHPPTPSSPLGTSGISSSRAFSWLGFCGWPWLRGMLSLSLPSVHMCFGSLDWDKFCSQGYKQPASSPPVTLLEQRYSPSPSSLGSLLP